MDTQCSVCRRAPAKFACSCAFPPVPVCASCLGVHADSEGMHVPTALQKKAAPSAAVQRQGNEVCDVCRQKPALRFCLCAVFLRKYCEDCDVEHIRKGQYLSHSEHPISAYAAVASGRVSLEAFQKKQQFIGSLLLRLGQELVNFDTFVNRVGEEFDSLLAAVTEKKEAVLRDLQTQRAKLAGLLSTAQQTVEPKRYAESFPVESTLDEVLLNGYQSSALPEIKMFTGQVDLREIQTRLEKAVTYEVASQLFQRVESEAIQEIPVIQGGSLRLYHPQTLQLTQGTLSQTTRIDYATAYCYIGRDTLLCCGGYDGKYNKEVWEVNVRTRAVVRMADMNVARGWLGIWNYKNECVYVFGGWDSRSQSLNTGEKYGLAAKSWTNLRSILPTAQSACSVCEHKDNLYISGHSATQSLIQRFNPNNEVFTLLRTSQERFVSIMCSNGTDVYCIWHTTIEQANLANGPTAATFSVKATIAKVESGNYWLCCPMKWQGDQLTSVLNPGGYPTGVFRFSPATSEFTQVLTFIY